VGGYWSGANLCVCTLPRYCVGGTLGYLGASDTTSGGYWSGPLCRILDAKFAECFFYALG
jgi:hypothetical protein